MSTATPGTPGSTPAPATAPAATTVPAPATAPTTTTATTATPAGTGASPGYEVDKASLDGATPKDLLPTTGNYPTEIVRYQSVVLTDIPNAKPTRKLTGAIDLGEENLPFYDKPAEGMVVTTEQSWSAQGVTLGRLLHSLALAPGESTKVAVVDWQNTTKATGTEKTTEADTLSSTTDQNRSISEVANAIAREEQYGDSSAAQRSKSSSGGGSIGLAAFFGGIGANWSASENSAFSTAVSRSTGVKTVADEASQRISARTQQLATAARSRNMTVVRETSQSEKDQVMTRVVTNYNHMHAMSVQYYEVVQVYSVTTKPTKLERCLFIPLQELTFTYSSLQRYKEVLASVAPGDWAAKIRAANPFDTTVRKLDALTAPETPTRQDFDGIDLADIASGPMGVYGVRKADGSPVRFDPVSRQWNPMPTAGLPSGGLQRIAPGKEILWGLQADKKLVHFTGTAWKAADAQGWQGLSLASGADDTLYLVGTDNTLWQRASNGTWTSLNVQADDVAVTSKGKLWYCRQGKTFTRTESGWQELSPSGLSVQRLSPSSDGAITAYSADNRTATLVPGATAWILPGNPAPSDSLATLRTAPGGRGEVWVLRNDGVLTRAIGAERGTQTPFDFQPKADSPYASRIDVWYDEVGIRSIQVIFPGQTARCGDTGGSGVQQRTSYTFGGADKLISVDAWAGTGARGSLSGLRLTMTSGVANFGVAETTTAAPDLSEDAGGASAICGLFGSVIKSGSRTYVDSLGFHVRGGNVSQNVLDHLNDNRRHYSQAVWANADELTLSRILANYSYAPAGSSAQPVLLGTVLDPKPIAATGNYLGFRWNFTSEQEREAWTNARKATATAYGNPVTNTVAIATKGVFAEAVLGRANSAEKIDLTRFWNWKDSPIQITPADIAPVSTASRAQNLDTKAAPLGASEARFTPLVAMPDPSALQTAQAIAAANLFRDMSGINTVTQVLTKGIEAAANNDKAAGERGQEALKTATEHLQKMQQLANEAAAKGAASVATGGASNLSALGGMMNQGGDKK
ncbi:hypothetical protein [Kitasatospora cineracea]|uniref:Uncharacterized protein n=1 Tax=Kitasatospora cineracea TaxID=88074 RepID=A0A3N4SEV5_9ACTN|nr:hypothetical protein [Kitasatospora cineracea]RPE37170.1 hypothetical protein EDD38_5571 [Kitasatospora cineracea]